MSSESKKYKRKWSNYLIFPRFQLSLLAINLFILIGSIGVVAYQVRMHSEVLLGFARKHNLHLNQTFIEMMENFKGELQMTLWLAVMASVLVCLIFTVVFSHKVVGSLYRLKSYFKDIVSNGYQGKLVFREGDLSPEIPEIVNEAIEKIQKDERESGQGVS